MVQQGHSSSNQLHLAAEIRWEIHGGRGRGGTFGECQCRGCISTLSRFTPNFELTPFPCHHGALAEQCCHYLLIPHTCLIPVIIRAASTSAIGYAAIRTAREVVLGPDSTFSCWRKRWSIPSASRTKRLNTQDIEFRRVFAWPNPCLVLFFVYSFAYILNTI